MIQKTICYRRTENIDPPLDNNNKIINISMYQAFVI